MNKDTLYSYVKKSEKDQDDQFKKVGKGIRDNNPKSANKAGHKFSMRSIGQGRAENRLTKEEVEEIEEMFPGTPEYEKKYGKAPQDMKKGEKKKTTQGEMEKTGKGVVHRRKFSEMIESYTEGGVKGLFRTLAEEPTSAEFDAQLDDAKKRAAGTKKQPEVSKPAVQAVQNEEYELTLEDFTQEELEEFMQTEEYEQLYELSKDTLKSYIPAAARDLSKKGIVAGINVKSGKRGVTKEYGDHFQKRYTGIIKATRKLAKESYEEQTHSTVSFVDYNDVNDVRYSEIVLEGRPSQQHPLEGHEYHKKSNEALIHIAKDAHAAAEAMKSHNTTAENKYRDQASDSATVRYFRQKNGMPEWYKKKYGHTK